MTGTAAHSVTDPAAHTAVLDHRGIAALLPHRDAMCLIDRVHSVDAARIDCRSLSHRRTPHPMADADGRLGAACGIEYGAQAMALHAALTMRAAAATARINATTEGHAGALAKAGAATDTEPKADAAPPQRLPIGMLAGVRAMRLEVDRLDGIDDELQIVATLLSGDPRTAIYELNVSAAGRTLLQGRATVIIEANLPPGAQA